MDIDSLNTPPPKKVKISHLDQKEKSSEKQSQSDESLNTKLAFDEYQLQLIAQKSSELEIFQHFDQIFNQIWNQTIKYLKKCRLEMDELLKENIENEEVVQKIRSELMTDITRKMYDDMSRTTDELLVKFENYFTLEEGQVWKKDEDLFKKYEGAWWKDFKERKVEEIKIKLQTQLAETLFAKTEMREE